MNKFYVCSWACLAVLWSKMLFASILKQDLHPPPQKIPKTPEQLLIKANIQAMLANPTEVVRYHRSRVRQARRDADAFYVDYLHLSAINPDPINRYDSNNLFQAELNYQVFRDRLLRKRRRYVRAQAARAQPWIGLY